MDASTDSPQEPTVSLTPSRRGVPLTLVLGLAVACNAITAVAVAPRLMPRPPAVAPSTPGVSPPRPPSSPITVPSSPSYRPRPVETEANVPTSDRFKRGVVLIAAEGPSVSSAGTGIVLTADGLIMTNYPVVRSSDTIRVTVASTGRTMTARMVGRDAKRDVALLRVSTRVALEPVTIDTDEVRIADTVFVSGNANGQGFVSTTKGNVMELNQFVRVKGSGPNDPEEDLEGVIQSSADAYPGDSGGPTFDADAEVLGMTTAGTTGTSDRSSFAIPIATALQVVDQIKAGDESGTVVIGPKSYLGIVVSDTTSRDGVHLTQVLDGSPAARAGLRPGDVLTGIHGHSPKTRGQLSDVLDMLEPGSQVDVEWLRSGGIHKGQLTTAPSSVN